jgi:hypothetical protein
MSGRDNGFVAHHYVPLADLDPRLADAMLEVLRSEAIAAYVEPSTGIMGGYLEMHMPDRPHDRLWVDRDRHDRAAALLNEQTTSLPSSNPAATASPPEASPPAAPTTSAPIPVPLADAPAPPQDATAPAVAVPPAVAPTLDDAWAELMAGYDQPADVVVQRWPASEDLVEPTPGRPDAEPSPPVRRRIVRPADTRSDEPGFGRETSRAELEERGPAAAAEPPGTYQGEYDPLSVLDEHFVPPSPPPPPALRPATKWAILAIVVGFGLIVARTFSDAVPQAITLGVLGIVGGFATLVAGMRPDRDDDSDSDDGAVV